MSDQDNGQVSTLQRPTTDDPEAWKTYWEAQGWTWRTEPEIDVDRQKYLAERRTITPDIEKGIYPFKDIKLNRADVEWLLATHENGRGPVDWSDKNQRNRQGPDLRGANSCQEDLRDLPLARLMGGLNGNEWVKTSREQHRMAALHLENAVLSSCHIEGAYLAGAHLEGANFSQARLERTDLFEAHLEDTEFVRAHLEGASLRNAFLDAATTLAGAFLGNKEYGSAMLSNIRWNETNLSFISWARIKELGDEHEAKQPNMWYGQIKNRSDLLRGYQRAIQANRRLGVALQAQGLNEDAARFAYRAQKLQRVVLWRQKKFGQYLFSVFLDLLAGYGYRPGRSVLWYLAVIFGFALAYFAIGHLPFFPDAFVFSLTSFHGRGFFPGLGSENSLHNPLVILAAFEAVIGLLIEISFIATFTQRFFGR